MAEEVLNFSQWFSDVSDSFKKDIAKIMKPVDATDGQVFCEEGESISSFIIVEKGLLIRTKKAPKFSLDDSPLEIDELGIGSVTGFLHVASDENEKAYATVMAKGETKVWLVTGEDFREVLASNPHYSSEVIKLLTKSIRKGHSTVRNALAKHMFGDDEQKKRSERVTGIGKGAFAKTLKVMCYDSTSWVIENFKPAIQAFNESQKDLKIQMDFTQDRLDIKTAKYAAGYEAVCLFVNDNADSEVIYILSMCGVKMIAMRCAGFDRVDTRAAQTFGISVARVPAYSPYAVAEHAIALLMTVNRKIHTASTRVKMANFSLDSGLLGLDIHGKTVGVMGTGKIGQILCRIITGFGANLLAFDVFQSEEVKDMGGTYVSKEEIYKQCDIIFLMMPLLPATKHTINEEVLPLLKRGVLLINTSRGGLIDTEALVSGLRSGIIGGCGLDVYENEGDYFFQDWSAKSIEDSTLVSLLGNNKVVMTAHQAFFTKEAIDKIVATTIENLNNHGSGKKGKDLPNAVFTLSTRAK